MGFSLDRIHFSQSRQQLPMVHQIGNTIWETLLVFTSPRGWPTFSDGTLDGSERGLNGSDVRDPQATSPSLCYLDAHLCLFFATSQACPDFLFGFPRFKLAFWSLVC